MNPFEILQVNESIIPDQKLVRQKYLAIQMGEHPDFGKDGEASEKANQAYSILKNDVERVKSILLLRGDVNLKENALSPDFLMLMMDLSDEIVEGISGDTDLLNSVKLKIQNSISELNAELKEFNDLATLNNWGILDYPMEFLNKLNSWFQKYMYLKRLEKNALGIKEL